MYIRVISTAIESSVIRRYVLLRYSKVIRYISKVCVNLFVYLNIIG